MFELRPVDEAAVRRQLVETCDGAKPFAAQLGRWIDSGLGSLTAWVPSEASPTLPESVQTGGLTPDANQEAAQLELVSRAEEFLAASTSGLIVLESQGTEASDPWLARFKGEWHPFQHACYFITREGSHEADLEHLYAGSCHWLDAWCFCSGEQVLRGLGNGLRDASAVDLQIESVWFSAYDAEGFIVWSPGTKP